MIRALVSIGTNSTRLLALDGDRRVAAASQGTRLGAGIAQAGLIDPAARERTLTAIEGYVAELRRLGAQTVDAIATSALRRADDGAAFAEAVAARVGVGPRILSGDEEATYSFLGATSGRDGDAPVAVLDVGGGSTELAIDVPARGRAAGRVASTRSLEIGAVRLAERHPALLGALPLGDAQAASVERAARDDAAAILAPLAAQRGFEAMIAVGGTVFTAASMLANGDGDGTTLDAAQRRRLIAELLALDVEARRAIPFIRPQRADILPAGLIVVDEACRLLGVDAFTVSEADLLLGYLTSPQYRAVPFPNPARTG